MVSISITHTHTQTHVQWLLLYNSQPSTVNVNYCSCYCFVRDSYAILLYRPEVAKLLSRKPMPVAWEHTRSVRNSWQACLTVRWSSVTSLSSATCNYHLTQLLLLWLQMHMHISMFMQKIHFYLKVKLNILTYSSKLLNIPQVRLG